MEQQNNEEILPRIVLTGGPGGGKTTALRCLEQYSQEIYLEPEAATLVLSSGFPVPNEERPWSKAWQNAFQSAVRGVQQGLDEIACNEAVQQGSKIIVQDRCMVDAAVYYDNTGEFEQQASTTIAHELGRVSLAIFFPTFAGTNAFDNRTNTSRLEEQSKMIELNTRLLSIWQNHTDLIVIDSPNLNSRVEQASKIITNYRGNMFEKIMKLRAARA